MKFTSLSSFSPSSIRKYFTRNRVITLFVALLGASVFHYMHVPLPFLLGSLTACLLCAILGMKLQGMGSTISAAMRTVIGVTIGTTVTPESIADLQNQGITLTLVPLFIIITVLIGMIYYRYIMKTDFLTAFYAAAPGGLHSMVLLGDEMGANARALSIIHAARLLIIVGSSPFVLIIFFDLSLGTFNAESAANMRWQDLLMIVGVAIVGWKVGEKIKLFGASIIGPLLLAAGLSLSGIMKQIPPLELILMAQYFIGIGIGIRYVGITMKEITTYVLSSLGYAVILAIATIVFINVVIYVNPRIGGEEVFLSFIPGGQAEMVLLALSAGDHINVQIVAIHQIARMILVAAFIPITAKVFMSTYVKRKLIREQIEFEQRSAAREKRRQEYEDQWKKLGIADGNT